MKNTYTNKLALTVVFASFAFLSLPASAGKDDIQSRVTQQVYQLQQQAKVAEISQQESATNKVVECKRLVAQGKKC